MAAAGIEFAPIKAGKFRRNQSAGLISKLLNPSTLGPNVRDVGRTVQGLAGAMRILHRYRPDVVLAKGGFVAFPVGLAAHYLHIPLVIHESDVTPGLGSRVLGRWANKIAVGFPVASYHDFDRSRLVFTGNPVRPELLRAHRLEGLAKFKLEEKLPTVLVTGGSGGARQINEVVVAALPALLEFCQVVHIAGDRDYERVKFDLHRLGKLKRPERYHLYGFLLGEMGMALAAADIVVARAGATTISEMAALRKPTVLIPNYEMAGHQVMNARVLARRGAVRILDGSKLTAGILTGEVQRLAGDEEEQARLAKAIGELAKPEAARELAELVLEVGAHGKPKAAGPAESEAPGGEGGAA